MDSLGSRSIDKEIGVAGSKLIQRILARRDRHCECSEYLPAGNIVRGIPHNNHLSWIQLHTKVLTGLLKCMRSEFIAFHTEVRKRSKWEEIPDAEPGKFDLCSTSEVPRKQTLLDSPGVLDPRESVGNPRNKAHRRTRGLGFEMLEIMFQEKLNARWCEGNACADVKHLCDPTVGPA